MRLDMLELYWHGPLRLWTRVGALENSEDGGKIYLCDTAWRGKRHVDGMVRVEWFSTRKSLYSESRPNFTHLNGRVCPLLYLFLRWLSTTTTTLDKEDLFRWTDHLRYHLHTVLLQVRRLPCIVVDTVLNDTTETIPKPNDAPKTFISRFSRSGVHSNDLYTLRW